MAYAIKQMWNKRGLSVPDDISIIGIDNSNLAQIADITSVEHPKYQLGRAVATNLLKLIEDSDFDATIEYPPVIYERSSVKDLNC
jgi:GntR family transcriptional regulator of arabinose operon